MTWSREPGCKSSNRTPPSISDCTTFRFTSSLRLGCGRKKLEEFSKETSFPLDALTTLWLQFDVGCGGVLPELQPGPPISIEPAIRLGKERQVQVGIVVHPGPG